MRGFICTLLILFTLTVCYGQSDNERLTKLRSIASSKASGLLTLSIDSFKRYLEVSPRSYGVFVYFTADATICEPCAALQEKLSEVAREYRGLPARSQARLPVFFATLKLTHSDASFLGAYSIERVPQLYYFGPNARLPKRLTGDDAYDVQKHGLGANGLREYVNNRVGSGLRVIRANYQVPFRATVKSLGPVLGAAFAAVAATVTRTKAYRSPLFWFFCVCAVYVYSVGGGHFSWIHDTPIFTVNRDGVAEYIAGGARSQYVAEGFFVSLTCVAISALIIAVQEMPRIIKDPSSQTAIGVTLTAATFIAISALLNLYHWKMPGYLTYNEI